MRPLVVSMQAFGPYAARQTLDFADLRDTSFFLITGPTGAGKTTILDAMSFALYGEASGGLEKDGARGGGAMRSHHADPDLLTRVRFDFSRGDELYRVERVPEQERPKIRGQGTTAHPREATLWRLRRDDAQNLATHGAPLASGWTAVTSRAEDILGFRAEQFRQVVMLPQGRFQRFLEADSGEREQILRALFETGHYAEIERALHDEALDLRRARDKLVERRDEVLRHAEAESAEALADRCARLALDHSEAREHAEQAERDLKTAEQALAAGREAARRLKERNDAAAEVAALATREEDVRARRQELEAARRAADAADVVKQAERAASDVTQARRAVDLAVTAATAATTALDAANVALEAQVARADERERAQADARRLRALGETAESLAAARRESAARETALGASRRRSQAADATWTEARDDAAAVEAAWIEAQAGLLAGDLVDGRPCPVCGSTEHPAPAPLPDQAPTQAAVEAARARVAAALERRDAAHEALRAAETDHAAATARVAAREEELPPDLVKPDALREALVAADRKAADLAAAHEAAVRAAHDREVAASAQAAARKAAETALAEAGQRSREADDLLARRLESCGFATREALLQAVRPPRTVDELAAAVREHEDATLRAVERRRVADRAAAGLEPPRLGDLEQAAADTAAAARTAREAAATLEARAETARRLLKRLRDLDEEQSGIASRHETIGRLADVAGGRNGRRVTFQSYVLGAFLDDVLVAASERLRLMSKNRYALDRTEERGRRRGSAGLDLVVYDAWTGVARGIATLSGGEKFMAALSLALGLAEVVQAFAGGIRLETVFVDEGFGSLDDESLDLAVAALERLHAGGRLVGIISHVSELRERVGARLEVTAGKSGSTAAFVVP